MNIKTNAWLTTAFSENRVLRRIFGPKRDDVAGGWRRLHYKELHNLYASPNIIRVNKSKRVRWERHVARKGNVRNSTKFFSENPKGRRNSKDLGVDGRIILEWILWK
jgi:hypothetical protein